MKVYFIPGLGADKKAFSFLNLYFCEPVFIEWLNPLPTETLPHYATRMSKLITEPRAIIVGVSFGGMIATEIAKTNPGMKAIIISSSKTCTEVPVKIRMWKYFPVYKWASENIIRSFRRIMRRFIEPKHAAPKKVFREMLKDSDPKFSVWATDAVIHWKNTEAPSNVIHIHGSDDQLLPSRLIKADHVVKGGRHLMIMDNGDEISTLLQQLITG